ncbi:rod shape-determining protein MreD [Candidatus Magnetomonas plexicatena]|uniref:rod shape-determining protein MreD n=1 Tax=Candidatus Magnetomonas plexicatena TaxID=2552947 RepID=UPI0011043463|nr:rod shape-determining protein MreD [Nitrospirales bacterium LBB_01]
MKKMMVSLFWVSLISLAMAFDRAGFLNFKLNLTMLLVYYMGLKWPESKAVLWSAGVGFIEDSLSLRIIGPNMLSKCSVIFITSFFRSGIFNFTPLLNSLLSFAFTIVDGFIVYFSLSVFDTRPVDISTAIDSIMFQSLINGVLGYFVMREYDE